MLLFPSPQVAEREDGAEEAERPSQHPRRPLKGKFLQQPLGSARLPECFFSLGKTKADLAVRKMLRLGKCQLGIAAVGWLPLQGRRRNTDTSRGLGAGGSPCFQERSLLPAPPFCSPSWGYPYLAAQGWLPLSPLPAQRLGFLILMSQVEPSCGHSAL